MSANERAEYLTKEIFKLQHVDDSAKMIVLSTPKIALLLVDTIIEEFSDVVGTVDDEGWYHVQQKIRDWQSIRAELEKLK